MELNYTTAGLVTLACLWTVGCSRYKVDDRLATSARLVAGNSDSANASSGQFSAEHPQLAGLMGGWVCSLNNDRCHAEAVIDNDNRVSIFLLASDTSELMEVPIQTLTGYFKPTSDQRSLALLLSSTPMQHNSPGMTSQLFGKLPAESIQQDSASGYLTVPGLMIEAGSDKRFVMRFQLSRSDSLATRHDLPTQLDHPAMPNYQPGSEQAELYTTAAGKYSAEDIADNGGLTASINYADFIPKHDPNPQPGDAICPITKTKANAACTWTIDGQTYSFCCPPCIDEFVKLAKESPEQIRPASSYRELSE